MKADYKIHEREQKRLEKYVEEFLSIKKQDGIVF